MARVLFGYCCIDLRWIIALTLLISSVSATRCEFCGQDFVVLGRHTWRCPARITGSAHPAHNSPVQGVPVTNFQGPIAAGVLPTQTDNGTLAIELTTCVCGRQCKGRRGLTSHQRTCRAFRDLVNCQHGNINVNPNDDLNVNSSPREASQSSADNEQSSRPSEKLLAGVKLPRTANEWYVSNTYFHSQFMDLLQTERSIDPEADVIRFQESIYGYFSREYGTINVKSNVQFDEKYKSVSVKSLKKSLHVLKKKGEYSDTEEIKFLSKLIREKLKSTITTPAAPSDKDFTLNFWKTCNDCFNRSLNILPKFTISDCTNYFRNTLSCINKTNFAIPEWFVNNAPPTSSANVTPPSYNEVARAINRSRGGASPCPLDQISILVLKRCPVLRTILHRLIVECWRTKYIPTVWRRGVTVLIYKKGDPTDPANFRPITLQPALYKVFSSIYRDRVQAFLTSNRYLNMNIQKGFVGGVEGVLEHTALLDYIMRSAKRRQLSLYAVLFDLRNAFGEIRHNLIRASLKYHHMPEEFVDLFNSIYCDFNISVACNNTITVPIHVQRGVLQGDPSSPLLFNICFNSLIKVLDSPNFKKLGFIWGNKASQSTNWLQYADDAALIARDQKAAQGLANLFDSWCSWAQMEIRLDKCNSFAMIKRNSVYCQILPTISINAGKIPPTQIGESFRYLGRIFDFDLKGELEKNDIVNKLTKLLQITTELKIRPQTKLKIFDRFITSQISFSLRVCNFTATWISETLDPLCIKSIRLWIEAPISSCVTEWLISPMSKCGMSIPSLKNRFERLNLSKRAALKSSPNENIRYLWEDTSVKNVNSDSLLLSNSTFDAQKILSKTQKEEAVLHLTGLPYQGKSIKILTENLSVKTISNWSKMTNSLPGFLFNFTRKAIQSQLPTLANLARWGRASSNLCPLCSAVQSNKHVLSNCSHPDALLRFTNRHNKILDLLASWFSSKLDCNSTLFVDLPGSKYRQVVDIFSSVRPDLAIVKGNSALIIELTICHETNLKSSKMYKENKYKNLNDFKIGSIADHDLILTTCELSVLGFLQFDNCVYQNLTVPTFDDSIINIIAKTVIQSSFDIYTHRDVGNV